jgi:EmrB/QacA subfamily drug resistance transporter
MHQPIELSPRAKAIVMAGTMLGMLVAAIDQTVVSTALPRIIGELGGLSLFSWVFTSYMLTSTLTVPLVGKFGDMYGRKPFFMAGILIFTIASALAGLSQNMTELIIFRGLQGVGAGAITANAFAIIGDVYSPLERGKYQGLFSAVFGLASIIGPTVGGTITDHLSWRWVFYVNIPVGVVAQAVIWYGFPWVHDRHTQHKIDYLGIATMTGAVVPLLLALVWAGDVYDWQSPQIATLLTTAGASLFAFLWIESRAEEPLLSLGLFGNRVFVVASSITFLTGIGMFGTVAFMPLFIQGALGSSATNSGIVTLPMMLGMVVSSTLAGQIVSRTGRYKFLVIASGLVMTIGMFLMGSMSAETPYARVVLYMIIVGGGVGIGMPVLGLAVQNAVPQRMLGVATSSTQFFRQIGGTIGVALFGTLLTTQVRHDLRPELPVPVQQSASPELLSQLEDPQALLSPAGLNQLQAGFAQFGAQADALFDQTVVAMRSVLGGAVADVFFVAMFVAAASFAITFFLPEAPLRSTVADAPPERAATPLAREAVEPDLVAGGGDG